MRALLCPVATYLAAALVHLAVWRLRRPRKEYWGILLIGLAVWAAAMTLWPAMSRVEFVSACLAFVSLLLAHVSTYSAIQADSPSMTLALKVAEAEPAGLPKERLGEILSEATVLDPRLRDLVTGGLAVLDGGRYRITPNGAALARVFVFYRGLLKMEKGG